MALVRPAGRHRRRLHRLGPGRVRAVAGGSVITPSAPPLARAAPPTHTGSRLTRLLGLAVAAGLVLLALLGLWWSPADQVQGDAVRIMYVHVPAAITAYLAFGVTALGSGLYLWRRS